MKKQTKVLLMLSASLAVLFVLFTAIVKFADVKAVGAAGTDIGLSSINLAVHKWFGVHIALYKITDWLSVFAFVTMFGFAVLGVCQLIKRKNLRKVDTNILLLGVFYIVVLGLYVLFEFVVINYRPILIDGQLEVSYPSSTTLLILCVMPTAIIQFNRLIKNKVLKLGLVAAISFFTGFMAVGRLVSGVHWFTDIVGGLILSTSLVLGYCAVLWFVEDKKTNKNVLKDVDETKDIK